MSTSRSSRIAPGYLYILSNPSMPGLLKIGLTTRQVPDRVAELNAATGVPASFAIEAYFESTNPPAHEKSVHDRLRHSRVRGKEFFRVSVEEAIQVVRAVTGQVPLGQIRQLSQDERCLLLIRDELLRSGRPAPEIWRCSGCLHSFFGPSATRKCPRCGGTANGPE
jgi:hypothetical protein